MCHEVQLTSRTPSLFQVVSGAGSASALNPNTNEANLNELHAANVTAAADDANGDHTTDAADASDANLLEELANGTFLSTNPEQVPPVQTPEHSTLPPIEPQPPSPALAQPIEPNANNSEPTWPVFVTHFPFGSPGAPVTSAQQGTSIYHSSREAFGDSVWAPFCSQCDWEVARWAKMWGPSSSAMEELLAIPGVRHTE